MCQCQAICEAKIKTLNEFMCFVQALRLVLEALCMHVIEKPTLIYNDNQGSINDWSKGWCWANHQMRYVSVRDMAIRDAREHKEIEIEHIGGELKPTGIFTKEHASAEK